MTHFYNRLLFPPDSRMTGIWSNSWVDDPMGDEVAMGHLISFPDNQDAGLESDFLSSHMPFNVGGFSGLYPDGTPWMFILQKAPADGSRRLMREEDPNWLMKDSLQRALRFNYEATIEDELTWTRGGLEFAYAREGIETDDIADWTTADLIRGLLTECCYVELSDIVDRHAAGCAFPDIEHDCTGDVFTDVFARWGIGLLQRPESPDNHEDNNDFDEDRDGDDVITEAELREMSRSEVKKIARELGVRFKSGTSKDDVVDLILDSPVETDEGEDDDDNVSDKDLTHESLEGKTLRELKKYGLESGFTAAEMKGLDIDSLIDLLVSAEDESDEDEDEDSDDDENNVGEWEWILDLQEMSRPELQVTAKEFGIRVRRRNSKKHRSRKRLIDLIMEKRITWIVALNDISEEEVHNLIGEWLDSITVDEPDEDDGTYYDPKIVVVLE